MSAVFFGVIYLSSSVPAVASAVSALSDVHLLASVAANVSLKLSLVIVLVLSESLISWNGILSLQFTLVNEVEKENKAFNWLILALKNAPVVPMSVSAVTSASVATSSLPATVSLAFGVGVPVSTSSH